MNKDLILREQLALQRTILANQSTFLAFLRTAMYFIIAGLSVNKILEINYGFYLELLLIIIGLGVFITGVINYRHHLLVIKRSNKHIGNYKDEYIQNAH